MSDVRREMANGKSETAIIERDQQTSIFKGLSRQINQFESGVYSKKVIIVIPNEAKRSEESIFFNTLRDSSLHSE